MGKTEPGPSCLDTKMSRLMPRVSNSSATGWKPNSSPSLKKEESSPNPVTRKLPASLRTYSAWSLETKSTSKPLPALSLKEERPPKAPFPGKSLEFPSPLRDLSAWKELLGSCNLCPSTHTKRTFCNEDDISFDRLMSRPTLSL